MLSVNYSQSSVAAQSAMNKANESLASSMKKITSGQRINSSSDDAAGLSIANRQFAQMRGMTAATRNVNDGISLVQTADGALEESTSILQRMRELATQSASDTNSTSDRESLQNELKQLVNEFDRIGSDTSYNGKQLLTGSFSNTSFQIGANAGQNLQLSITSAKASDVGGIAKATGTAVTANTALDITIKVGTGSTIAIGSSANYAHSSDTYKAADSAFAKATAINAADSPVLATASTTRTTADLTTKLTQTATAASSYVLSLDGTSIMNKTLATGDTVKVSEVVSAINSKTSTTGFTATLDTATNKITVADTSGRNMTLTETVGGSGITTLFAASGDFAASGTANRGYITLSANETITVGGTTADIGAAASVNKDALGIDSIDITSKSGSETAIQRIDSALENIDKSRASLGASKNRFDSIINTLNNSYATTAQSRSRIIDLDYAKESANLMKQQIISQAAQTMLQQASSNQQSILSLLK